MADHRHHVSHPMPVGPAPHPEALRKRSDHFPSGARRAREVFDLEMAGIPDHSFRQVGRQDRLEGPVLVDGDLIAIDEERGRQEGLG